MSQQHLYWHFGLIILCPRDAVLGIVGCLPASLSSMLEMIVAMPSPFTSSNNPEYLQIIPNISWEVWGKIASSWQPFLVAQMVKNLHAMWVTQIQPLGQEVSPEFRVWQPTPVLLPGEFCGQRNLQSMGPKELEITEWLRFYQNNFFAVV